MRRRRRTGLAATALAVGALVTVSVQSAAGASGTWSPPTSVDSGASPTSVSCPTVKFCIAVDGTGNAVIHKRNNTWETPDLIDAGGGGLASVSCASTTFCMAVDGVGNEVRYANGNWFRKLSIDPGVALDAVSCKNSALCVVVDDSGNALVYDGTEWVGPTAIDSTTPLVAWRVRRRPSASPSTAPATPSPTTARPGARPSSIDTVATLTGLSCTTAAWCVAVDEGGNALSYNGVVWTSPTSVDLGVRSTRCRVPPPPCAWRSTTTGTP